MLVVAIPADVRAALLAAHARLVEEWQYHEPACEILASVDEPASAEIVRAVVESADIIAMDACDTGACAMMDLSCEGCPLGAYLRAIDQIRDIKPVEDLT